MPIPPELYPLIAKELAIHKHLRLNRLTNAFDRVCLWVLKEARKLLRPQQVAKMYQIMVGMFLGFTHPHVEVFRIPRASLERIPTPTCQFSLCAALKRSA